MQRKESQFSAGTACEPCQVMGHFCPAHDFNRDDDPACAPCLSDQPCAQKQVRNGEFDKAVDPEPKVAKPEPPKRNLLRGAALFARNAKPTGELPASCEFCREPKHKGRCAARRAAAIAAKDIPLSPILEAMLDHPELGTPVADSYGGIERNGIDAVPDTTHADEHVEALQLDALLDAASRCTSDMKPIILRLSTVREGPPVEPIPDPPAEPPIIKKVVTVRTIRVVPLASLPPQLNWKSKYEHEVATFCALTPGNCMEIACTDAADAKRYAKLFSGFLDKRKLRARYRVTGDSCFFWKREASTTSNSEVLSR